MGGFVYTVIVNVVLIGGEHKMLNDMARVTVTITNGHFVDIDSGEMREFDESIYGRYKPTRFASLMRKHYNRDSIVCTSVSYEIRHYLVDVGDLDNIALHKN